MLITCLRHATAQAHISPNVDAERDLVGKGRNQAQRIAEFCRKNALIPGALYCSPLRRAQQTAALLQTSLPGCPPAICVDWLSLGASPLDIVSELQKLETVAVHDVWLVGHEPDLSSLFGRLLNTDSEHFVIKKASLTRIDIDFADRMFGHLLWSIPCALMR